MRDFRTRVVVCPSCGSLDDAKLFAGAPGAGHPAHPAGTVSRQCQACDYSWTVDGCRTLVLSDQ